MMKKTPIYLMVTLLLAAGCSQAERTNMAHQADQNVRKAGQALDEGLNSTRIKSALMASRKVDASHINVDSSDTTVFLRGSVKTLEQKKIAHDLTNTMIEPGQKLVDELKVAAAADDHQPQ